MLNRFSAALSEFTTVAGDANSVQQHKQFSALRSAIMGMKLKYITPLLAAGAAAVAIAAAPTAFAANQQSCSGTVCQSPGNVQIHTPPPHVQYHPYGPHMSSAILTGQA